MPRDARYWDPDDIGQFVARGHCGAGIFGWPGDREFFVCRAARSLVETETTCLGWSLLGNHYHLLGRCPQHPRHMFARLNTAIACRERRLRGGRGAVFQDRYFSAPAQDEGGVMELLAYVLGNPVHHRVVPTIDALRTYAWSGLAEVLGLRPPRLVDVPATLALIDPDPARARRRLLEFLDTKARMWRDDGADPDTDRPPFLELDADDDVADVGPVPAQDDAGAPPTRLVEPASPRELTWVLRNTLRREQWTPHALLPVVCSLTGAGVGAVSAGRRARAEAAARAVIAHVACDVAGWAMTEVAPHVGVGPTALVRARATGRALVRAMGVDPTAILTRSRTTLAIDEK